MIRVLVIDDEPAYRESLRLLMPTQGFIVETAASAESAMQSANTFAPDVIVVDWMLRRSADGVQVAIELCQRFPKTCVIVISSYPTATLETRLLELPNVRFLPKPFTLSSLVGAIRSLLAKSA
jgi:DNA-binding response OmpR family regulator